MTVPRDPATGIPGRKTAPFACDSGQGRGHYRPVETRNGIPWKPYPLHENTFPESMTEAEAAYYLGSTWRPDDDERKSHGENMDGTDQQARQGPQGDRAEQGPQSPRGPQGEP